MQPWKVLPADHDPLSPGRFALAGCDSSPPLRHALRVLLPMGGSVPLGYDARDRTLVINQTEAETVRHIFRSYLAVGSVRKLQESLAAEGIRSKLQPNATAAKMRGGKPFERGALYLILQNRLYRGEIRHKDAAYPGQHEAIVDHATWEAVQQQLEQNRAELTSGQRASMPSLLAGLLYD